MGLLILFFHLGNRSDRVAIPFLFVLTIVVFVHELGHFLVARRCGVGADVLGRLRSGALWLQ